MACVSERLQRARKDAGLTLHQVADQTRIQHWILEAIERDDLSRVPGGVFIRGYLISFAQAVGLDGERVWADYRAEMRTAAAELAPDDPQEPPSGGVSRWTIVAIAAAVLVAAVVWHNRSRSNRDTVVVAPLRTAAPEPQPRTSEVLRAAAATSGPAAGAVAAVDSRDAIPASPALPTSPVPLIVKVHASSDVWMDAKVDGEQRVYRLAMAGEDVSLGARNQIVLLVGDASAVTYEINGMPGRALGAAGAVRELVITPANYTTFVDGSR